MKPESSALLVAIIDLVPVLGGALIGVIGGLVGTKYAHRLGSKDTDKSLKRSNLEDLVTEVYEVEIWLKKQENYYLYGGDEAIEQSPISKIEALEALYFPELSGAVSNLSAAEQNYRGWLLEGAKIRTSKNLKTAPMSYLDTLNTVYQPLILRKSQIIEKAKKLSKEFNAP